MNNKRNIILSLVIVVLFAASALIIYQGIYANSSGAGVIVGAAPDVTGNQKEIINLLPYGNELDFSQVKSRHETTQVFKYEQLDANSVGVDTHNLIARGALSEASAVKTSVDNAVRDNPVPKRGQVTNGQ
ncbi:MAG: hypothetical protein JNK33_02100 [Candidatus Doudnabacteria bacterium]|nr:hypothetical protein [Candidatus Doudnabacteria bacterium]